MATFTLVKMRPLTTDYIATHKSPCWKSEANFIFGSFVGKNDKGELEWEQLWGTKISSGNVILCCIPFFARNINLGDELTLDADCCVEKLVAKSGHFSFRIWLKGEVRREFFEKNLIDMAEEHEWSSCNMLVVSTKQQNQIKSISEFLEVENIIYEAADD